MEKDLLAKAVECARKAFVNLLEQIDLLIQKHRPEDLAVVHISSAGSCPQSGRCRP
jgi:hypothetical protein